MTKIQKIVIVAIPLLLILMLGGYKYYTDTAAIKKYDFTITTDKGEVGLKDFRGKKTLVYFGYGLCPDICPTTLVAVSEALNSLNKDELNNVAVVFITLDPERDSPAKLGEFVRYFHPSIIGGATTLENTQAYVTAYGANFKKIPQPDSSIGYSVAHTADVYVVDKNGKLEAVLPFGAPPSDIAAAIKK